ncbi:MAG: TrkH family potassium uptake protein [Oscillospiraceae bacterium]|nr:TrkH family potassium uptake protein [Oscillospiraceae bacterium]
MNYKMMGRFIAQIIAIELVFLLPPLGISLFYGEWDAVRGFVCTIAISGALSGLLYGLCRRAGRLFGAREGLVCVGFSWIVLSILGCLPFLLSGAVPKFVEALFETVSGFTTTGASILPDVESMPRGLLYWRSFTHWVGGMGVLVFLLAISTGGEQGKGFTMHLMRAESPGPDVGKLVPKMRQTATILYGIYIVMTAVNVVFLLLGGMPLFEALCTAFGTAGTGGFGIKNDSLAGYSPYIQNVTTVFMFLFGVNFSCYYLLLLKQFRVVIRDEELRLYIGIVFFAIVLIVANTYSLYGNLGETVRHAAFQVSSIMTTTGYTTTDYDLWPSFSKGILMMLMVVGACAGSTGGGIKVARVLLLFKILQRNIRGILNPRKVMVVRNNGRAVDEKVLDNTNAYLAAYVIIVIICFMLISLDGFSIGTNISAVLACFNNIGPGMEAVGPTLNFSAYSDFSKVILSIAMLAGRLEIFPILVLLSRSTWKVR